ncbi:MAG: DUF896 domain-containing protein [Anaerovoracaceae bacterium]
MISEEKIARINQLAAKAKTQEGLTKEELAERDALRKEYIAAMRHNVREHLKNVRFVEDLSPEERAKYEQEKKS